MFPLRDSIPSARPPVVNILLIGACVITFFYQLLLGPRLQEFVAAFGFVPARLFHPELFRVTFAVPLLTFLTSMFMHGGWLHLIGNLWFLWVFGDNVEDCMGHGRFLLFYLASGVAATLGQALLDPTSTVPQIGASGAIAGVLGAYLVWFPWSRVKTLFVLIIIPLLIDVPAPLFLVLWFVMQFFSGTLSLAAAGAAAGGVAWWAHIGGFLFGALAAVWLRRTGRAWPCQRHDLGIHQVE